MSKRIPKTPMAEAVAEAVNQPAPPGTAPAPANNGPGFTALPDQLRQALVQYLATRPWNESNDLIVGLMNLPRLGKMSE